MNWKTDYRSIYYLGAPEPPDLDLRREETAMLVIDVQNTYRQRPDRATLSPEEQARFDLWTPFYERLEAKVIPNTADLLARFRKAGMDCLHARIASHTRVGRERSLSHRKPGWNDLLLPKDDWASQIVPELAPVGDEIVVTKMTDSALTGSKSPAAPHQHRHSQRGVLRRVHRPVRVLDGAQPRRRELQRRRGRGLLRRRLGGTAPQGARDHQHDLLPGDVVGRAHGDDGDLTPGEWHATCRVSA